MVFVRVLGRVNVRKDTIPHTHTHTHTYVILGVCACVCACVYACVRVWGRGGGARAWSDSVKITIFKGKRIAHARVASITFDTAHCDCVKTVFSKVMGPYSRNKTLHISETERGPELHMDRSKQIQNIIPVFTGAPGLWLFTFFTCPVSLRLDAAKFGFGWLSLAALRWIVSRFLVWQFFFQMDLT